MGHSITRQNLFESWNGRNMKGMHNALIQVICRLVCTGTAESNGDVIKIITVYFVIRILYLRNTSFPQYGQTNVVCTELAKGTSLLWQRLYCLQWAQICHVFVFGLEDVWVCGFRQLGLPEWEIVLDFPDDANKEEITEIKRRGKHWTSIMYIYIYIYMSPVSQDSVAHCAVLEDAHGYRP
jgi:hypothetical protein